MTPITDADHLEAERMLAEARRQLDAKIKADVDKLIGLPGLGRSQVHAIFGPILADFDRTFGGVK